MMARAMPARPLVIMGFVLVMTSLGLLGASSWHADKQLASATGLVAHTLEVLTTLEQIKSHMAQAESAQRGYFLQQQPSFLSDREAALDAVWAGIVTIERLTRDNPAQGERITNLRRLFVDQNAVFAEARLQLQPGRLSRQDAYFSNGTRTWNALEDQTDGIQRTEDDLLATRIADEASSGHTARVSFVLLMGLLFMTIGLLLLYAYRDIGRKRHAGAALNHADGEPMRHPLLPQTDAAAAPATVAADSASTCIDVSLIGTIAPAPVRALALDGVRLLIVDDSDINRDIAQRILTDQGAHVTLAVDGRAALDWLLAHPDDVDLVLMDVQMPVMDGLEATRQLRRLPQFDDLPVIALSAGAFKMQRDEASAAGMNDFVSKPFDVPAIIALVQRLHRQSRTGSAVTTSAAMTMDVARGLQLWPDIRTYRDYLQRFARSHADVIGRLQGLLLAGDRRRAAALSHKLSGDAANLGLPELHRLGGLAERILSDGQDTGPALQQLHAALTLTLQAIARYAPALAPQPDKPEVRSVALLEPDRSDLQSLLRNLLIALDSDSPAPVEPLLAALATRLPRAALAPLREYVHGFDFRAAEAAVRLLARQHELELKV
ncbi:response regulator [Actimicrobium sp. CCC2.4]|uniref:response regulator n=1 Tax=Actimicrobium sp. CCC2.4 TaxID=3048606 RepID=UPI002AC95EA5|nr:response regulator [Actimicrobium sp. CCC2.4]MEB0136511.1 response regulator [Actimicrobium sp. CCC2.4]WPX30872.1 response regulator [Actimicrobium sp. CCC2.4]